jgi:oligopeptide transport system permease protein
MATAPGLASPSEDLALATDQYEVGEQISLWQDSWRRIRRNRLAVAGLVWIVFLFLVAIVAHFWTPYPVWLQAVGPTYAGPSLHHPFGLDSAGRDVLSRTMGGAEIAIEVGVGTSLVVSLIGITLGLVAGFYRGWIDYAISFVINIFYGIPDLLVALIFVVLIGRGLQNIILAISITAWMGMARLVRGQTLSLREREFVEAARSTGTRDHRILIRHILPNALGPIIVQATFLVPAAIIFEAFLSFLGLGVKPPTPSWGAMASDGFHSLQIAAHIALFPCLALSITVLAFNWVGDGLRDAIDPRMRK